MISVLGSFIQTNNTQSFKAEAGSALTAVSVLLAWPKSLYSSFDTLTMDKCVKTFDWCCMSANPQCFSHKNIQDTSSISLEGNIYTDTTQMHHRHYGSNRKHPMYEMLVKLMPKCYCYRLEAIQVQLSDSVSGKPDSQAAGLPTCSWRGAEGQSIIPPKCLCATVQTVELPCCSWGDTGPCVWYAVKGLLYSLVSALWEASWWGSARTGDVNDSKDHCSQKKFSRMRL